MRRMATPGPRGPSDRRNRALIPAVLVGLGALVATGWLEHYVVDRRSYGYSHETLEPSGVQSIYLGGVPHTDAQGSPRSRYDAASFFPRCIYHAVPGSFMAIKAAGFNCVHTWEGVGVAEVIEDLRSAGLQLIRHSPTDDEVRRFGADPRILGWYLDEEPTGHTFADMLRTGNPRLMAERYQAFVSRKTAIKAVDPRHPVFPLDASGIPPGQSAWWDRWNSSGDITAHDNYPLRPRTTNLEALARSVLRAVRLNRERKPVWITLQAFGGSAGLAPRWRMPTPQELRGMAFIAIIHGATGIILFAYDSRVTRAGDVIGFSPETPASYGSGTVATDAEAQRSRMLWTGAAALNAELERLTPRLLSPTARLPYDVYSSGESRISSPIRTMLKETGGVYTLLAANLEGGRMGARYRFPKSITSVRRLNADGSDTVLEPNGPMFGDTLSAFDAAVYEITFRLSHPPLKADAAR
jgi:hypothetical protein